MSLNLIKLCVGAQSVDELSAWQERRLSPLRKAGKPLILQHVTRQMPKRRDDILDGGSLYWVVKGYIAVRQRIVDLRSVVREGLPQCAICYSPELIPVVRRAHRPFQGWRYLEPADAPADLRSLPRDDNFPDELRVELANLG
ncbi:MAG: DUF1489 domain-containing protein, partial [Alphaproteobacteria bacterium]|nr:DUF1489 domain-containing protein [Alphaproteobacteria bacterium]